MATSADPIPQAKAIATALQPANVAMAQMVDLLGKLVDAASKTAGMRQGMDAAARSGSGMTAMLSTMQGMLGILANPTGVMGNLGKIIHLVGNAASQTGAALGKAGFKDLGNILGKIGEVAGPAGAVVGLIASIPGIAMQAVESILGFVPGLIGQVKGMLGPFVELFRPDLMRRFELITNDVMASIGEGLIPMMEVANTAFRWLGNTIAGMTPILLPLILDLIQTMTPFAEEVGNAIREIISAYPVVEMFGAVKELFIAFLPAMRALLEIMTKLEIAYLSGVQAVLINFTDILIRMEPAITAAANAMLRLFRILMPFTNFDPNGFKPGDSQGKAVKKADFTDLDSVWKKQMESTFGAGRAADPMLNRADQQIDWLKKIHADLANMANPAGGAVSPPPQKLEPVFGQGGYMIDQWRQSQLGRG